MGSCFIFAVPNAEVAQLVEHDLAKVGVASSNLVFCSEMSPLTRVFFRPSGEMVDTQDLKSCILKRCAGSSPASGTFSNLIFNQSSEQV